jgi:hypothetical protein
MTISVLDLITDVHRHGARLEADTNGILRIEGRVCSGLWADISAHTPRLLAVISRLQRMTVNAAGQEQPPVLMAHWPAAFGPGHCQSCGQVLDHPRGIGRCADCDVAAELFYRLRRDSRIERSNEFVHRLQGHD